MVIVICNEPARRCRLCTTQIRCRGDSVRKECAEIELIAGHLFELGIHMTTILLAEVS
jgi:hypothetical protein